ncbi:hypothetical protein ACFQU2_28990 [Siccirubricoccus deserti]
MEQEWNPSVMAAPVFGLEAAAAERLLLAAMPPGWRVLGRCRYGTAGPAVHATGCHALAHPAFGIALIDVAPDATPNAESRLRRALNAVRFWEEFPGNLPVWHGRVEGGALRELDGLVRDAFADMSPLTVPGKSAWVAAAAAALAEDAAWQVPGRPLRPALAPLMIEHETAAPRHAWRSPRLAATAGFALTFILGLGAGALLLGDESPAPVRTSEAATQAGPEVAAVPATRTPPAEATAGPPSDGRPLPRLSRSCRRPPNPSSRPWPSRRRWRSPWSPLRSTRRQRSSPPSPPQPRRRRKFRLSPWHPLPSRCRPKPRPRRGFWRRRRRRSHRRHRPVRPYPCSNPRRRLTSRPLKRHCPRHHRRRPAPPHGQSGGRRPSTGPAATRCSASSRAGR